jgi:hypothetical protein
MENWFLLYSTRNLAEATIIKGMLEENHVPVVLMNKQDSSYLNFGEVEIYVAQNMKELATRLLNNNLMN